MTMIYRFRYLLSLCASTLLSVGWAQAQQVAHVNFKSGSKYYQQRTAQFERQMPVDSSMVVMLGDSHTEGGGDWNLLLGTGNVVNRGINGDHALGIEARLCQVLPGQPKAVFLLCGANDLSFGLSAETVAARICHLIDTICSSAPQTRLVVQSLLPINESFGRWKTLKGRTDDIPVVNTIIAEHCNALKVPFLNLFPLFTNGEDNVLVRELCSDGLHLNHDGYAVWAEALQPYIDWVNGVGDAGLFFNDLFQDEPSSPDVGAPDAVSPDAGAPGTILPDTMPDDAVSPDAE